MSIVEEEYWERLESESNDSMSAGYFRVRRPRSKAATREAKLMMRCDESLPFQQIVHALHSVRYVYRCLQRLLFCSWGS